MRGAESGNFRLRRLAARGGGIRLCPALSHGTVSQAPQRRSGAHVALVLRLPLRPSRAPLAAAQQPLAPRPRLIPSSRESASMSAPSPMTRSWWRRRTSTGCQSMRSCRRCCGRSGSDDAAGVAHRDFEHVRHGSQSLIAAAEVATGGCTTSPARAHRAAPRELPRRYCSRHHCGPSTSPRLHDQPLIVTRGEVVRRHAVTCRARWKPSALVRVVVA
jgi:hypothetical protein